MGNYQTEEKIRGKFESIKEAPEFWNGRKVADIGSCEGMLYPILREYGADYVGVEASLEYVAEAKEKYPEARFICGDLRDFSEKVDIIVSFSTLHIFNDDEFETIIKKYSKLCRVLIFEVPVEGKADIYYTRSEEKNIEIASRYFEAVYCYGISPSPHDPQSIRKTFKCENYKRKKVKIEDIYTRSFNGEQKLTDCILIGFAKEMLEGVEPLESNYYKWMKKMHEERGAVFGNTSKEWLRERAVVFSELARSLRGGFDNNRQDEKLMLNGVEYGGLIAKEQGLILIDGHHRLSVLHNLGIKEVKVKLCI